MQSLTLYDRFGHKYTVPSRLDHRIAAARQEQESIRLGFEAVRQQIHALKLRKLELNKLMDAISAENDRQREMEHR